MTVIVHYTNTDPKWWQPVTKKLRLMSRLVILHDGTMLKLN